MSDFKAKMHQIQFQLALPREGREGRRMEGRRGEGKEEGRGMGRRKGRGNDGRERDGEVEGGKGK